MNATCSPLGEICGSATQRKWYRSDSEILRFCARSAALNVTTMMRARTITVQFTGLRRPQTTQLVSSYNDPVPVTTNFQNWSPGKKRRAEIVQSLEAALAGRPGKWHIQFIGGGGEVELRVSGPATETSQLIDPEAAPSHIADEVIRILQS